MNPTTTITGRLGRTPEIAFTPNGKARASFSVATSASKRQPDGTWLEGPASWWRVTAWGKTAEHLADSNLAPGTEITITGELSERTYKREDGSEGRVVELDARTVAVSLARGPVTVTDSRSN